MAPNMAPSQAKDPSRLLESPVTSMFVARSEGFETPNLLIRRPIFGVREGCRWFPFMASELRLCVGRFRSESGVYQTFRYIFDTSTVFDLTF